MEKKLKFSIDVTLAHRSQIHLFVQFLVKIGEEEVTKMMHVY